MIQPLSRSIAKWTAASALAAVVIGCHGPDKANVTLRKENQDLKQQVDQLKHQHDADVASLAAEQAGTTQPAVGAAQLDQLFTVASIDLNKLTSYRDDALKVYVTPKDSAGDTIKMAGAVTIDAFDLSIKDKPQVGHWEFPANEAGKNWFESLIVRGYALNCPVKLEATTTELTVRVSFVDTLTARTLTAQKVIATKVPDSRVSNATGQ